VETIVTVATLLCTGLCCLVSAGGLLGAVYIHTRGSDSTSGARGERKASTSTSAQRALSTAPPEPRLGGRREPAAETAILPTPLPTSPSLRAAPVDLSDELDDIETVVASPPTDPARSTETPVPVLPSTRDDPVAVPKQTPGPRSSGQTIIAFDDDDEDW
jgi:hypothetical protein